MVDLKENNDLTGYEIAVIGMAGRFPGAASIAEFWENLEKGRNTVSFFSAEELGEAGAGADLVENPVYVKAKGMLEEVDGFDTSFFNYTLREGGIMDPQLRILLECSWNALEDAGYDPKSYEDSIGFYVGAGTHFYWIARLLDLVKDPSENFGIVSLNDSYSISTQVSYRLNLKGPAVTLHTACSTSLVAVHAACQALLSGECDMALAGGVSVRLPNKSGYIFQEGMVLSPDGHCRAFDAKAAGCFGGNGVGIVVLKPLENAIEDGDHIYALVKGTAVNNDGDRKMGYSAPSVKGQAEVIRIAQKAAGVEPESITYIEAHGTGTPLGDTVEIRALTRAFDTEKKGFCRIGSVKSNIGHLDAAAGAAGFIKTVLALNHRKIPPSLHFETPNPEIDFENSPFIVNTELRDWKNDEYPLRAGVSSFGIGGTNAHVVMEEWSRGKPLGSPQGQPFQLLPLSAGTEGALERNTDNLVAFLKKNPDINFADAVYTLQVGRKAFAHRRILVCRDAAEAVEILSTGNPKKVHTRRVIEENPPVIFMFPGLGSQYVEMGYGLYRDEPVFRKEMDRCFEILNGLVDYDIKGILYPSPVASKDAAKDTGQTDIAQLLLFMIEYALAKLLMNWGIMPYAMTGYSFGEYAAACIAGVFTLEDALKLMVQRGELIDKTPEGAMLSVPLTGEELLPLLPGTGELSLAIDNGPSCIIAGPGKDVDDFEKQLKQKKYICMRLNTSRAIHSTLMSSILAEFEDRVKEISLQEPQIPYISNLTGKWITAPEAVNPAYWVSHLAGTVRFGDGIKELVKEPNVVFVELGPGRDLSALIRRFLGENQQVVNLVRPPQKETADTAFLLDRLGRLWLYGKEIDWKGFYDGKADKRYRVSLPAYSFDRGGDDIGDNKQMSGDYAPPADEVEGAITEAFRAIFGQEQIGVRDDFFELGGDSLKVITLVTRLHRQLDVEIPMETVFKHSTVEEIADWVKQKSDKQIYTAIPPVEEKEYYPLTPSQLRLFILDQIEEKNKAYNVPSVLWMKGNPDIPRLERACKGLIERHESFRTGFFFIHGEAVQRVYKPGEIGLCFEYHDVSELETKGRDVIMDDFLRPFNLSSPPLWRVGIVKMEPEKYILMQNIHHIVTDDISTGVIISELAALSRGESLGELSVRYKDYAVWQREVAAADSTIKKQKEYWLGRFSDAPELPVLGMPLDYPRPKTQTFEGDQIEFRFDAELSGRLVQLARKNRTTLFVLLFAFYNTLLYRYTGQEDIIVGTPIAGRYHRDVQPLVGMFVNTLTLRNHPGGDKRFEDFLQEVKEELLGAFSNQLYPFEDLVEQLDIPRDMSRNPLFDTMFVLHTVDVKRADFPGVEISPYEFDISVSKFDITLNAAETADGELYFMLEYSTALYKKETVQRFANHFTGIAEELVKHPQSQRMKLDEIEMFAKEKEQILYKFNDTAVDYPRDKTICGLFEEQVEKSADSIALMGHSAALRHTVSYKELNERADRLSHVLRSKGVKPESIVGIMPERSVDMMAGILGILKAGGAYLPIDADYPLERVHYMFADSGAKILLVMEDVADKINEEIEVIDLCKGEPLCSPGVFIQHSPYIDHHSGNPAYVTYTSGSTGKPKGVMIEHRSVINFIKGITDIIPFGKNDRILSLTTITFDIFVLETLLPLTAGSKIVVGNKEEQLSNTSAARVMGKEDITIFQLTPSRLQLLMGAPESSTIFKSLGYLLVGGEAFPKSLLEKVRSLFDGKIYNLYGPTETTVWSAVKDVSGQKALNIGTPIANTSIFILNKSGGVQPIGVSGELCIGGDGLSRGYLNRPELTNEKFILTAKAREVTRREEKAKKIYRTGDLARWLPDGNIEFLGRIDYQVKIRGFRIELEEIENQLQTHTDIKEAVVVPGELQTGGKYLCAYVVLYTADSATSLNVTRLREFLSLKLPDYMIPSYFVPLEKIPLTPNGKVERKALPGIQGLSRETGVTYVAPETETEKMIVQHWQRVLQLEKEVGIEDNFFDLGGNSFELIRLNTELNQAFEANIPVMAMLRYPTIRSFVEYLDRGEFSTMIDRTEKKRQGKNRWEKIRDRKKGG